MIIQSATTCKDTPYPGVDVLKDIEQILWLDDTFINDWSLDWSYWPIDLLGSLERETIEKTIGAWQVRPTVPVTTNSLQRDVEPMFYAALFESQDVTRPKSR